VPQVLNIEIADRLVKIKLGDELLKRTTLARFIRECGKTCEMKVFDEPIPDGVRFVRTRGSYTLVVSEMKPQVRSIRWLSDTSPSPYGESAVYETVRLAFPYVVLFVVYGGPSFTGLAQCFFRTAPISCGQTDMLFFPNLRNCHDADGLVCRLCLGHVGDVPEVECLPWDRKISTIVESFWTKGFNRSAEAHGLQSYWSEKRTSDPRVSGIAQWQKATLEDPLFPLKVKWAPAGFTVDQNVEALFRRIGAPPKEGYATDIMRIVNMCEPHEI
jgi:hypothetical protein